MPEAGTPGMGLNVHLNEAVPEAGAEEDVTLADGCDILAGLQN